MVTDSFSETASPNYLIKQDIQGQFCQHWAFLWQYQATESSGLNFASAVHICYAYSKITFALAKAVLIIP